MKKTVCSIFISMALCLSVTQASEKLTEDPNPYQAHSVTVRHLPDANEHINEPAAFRPKTHIQGKQTPSEPLAVSGIQSPPSKASVHPFPVDDRQKGFGDTPIYSFAGLGTDDGASSPADNALVVGKGQVIHATNFLFQVYNRNGDVLKAATTLSSLFSQARPDSFGARLGFYFDPVVVWSEHHQKFVMVVLGMDNTSQSSLVFMAVSQTHDATGDWWVYAIPQTFKNNADDADKWLDFPKLAVDQHGVYVTTNLFPWNEGETYSKLFVFTPSVLQGEDAEGWTFRDFKWPPRFTTKTTSITPVDAHDHDGRNRSYFMSVSTSNRTNGINFMWLSGHDGADPDDDPTPVINQRYLILDNHYEDIHDTGAIQRDDDGDRRLAVSYLRVRNAILKDDMIWAVMASDAEGTATSTSLHTFQINVADEQPVVAWESLYGNTDCFYIYPAIMPNINGDTDDYSIFTDWVCPASGSNGEYASSGVLISNKQSPASTTFNIMAYGTDTYTDADDDGDYRWGDYNDAAWDFDCNLAWGVAQHATGSLDFGNTIEGWQLSNAGGCDPIDVLYPDGNESLFNMLNYTISWQADDIPNHYIALYWINDDAGGQKNFIANPNILATALGRYTWDVADVTVNQARILVEIKNGANHQALYSEYSDAPFRIYGTGANMYSGKAVNDDLIVNTTQPVSAGSSVELYFEIQRHNLFPISQQINIETQSEIRLSSNNVCSNSDTLLKQVTVEDMTEYDALGQTHQRTRRIFTENIALPGDLADGNYYLCVMADSAHEVEETDEADNYEMVTLQVSSSSADLWFEHTSGVPGLATPGSGQIAYYRVENQGDAPSGNFQVEVRLSENADCSVADPLKGTNQHASLNLGQMDQFNSVGVDIPLNWAGNYAYLCFEVDSGETVVENNETNNHTVVAILYQTDRLFGDSFETPEGNEEPQ